MVKTKNLIKVAKAMEHKKVVSLVEKASRRIECKLHDVTSFEYTCYTNIGDALLTQKEIRSVEALARHIINKAIARHLRKSKYKAPIYLESLSRSDEDGNETHYEIVDVSADVEQDVIDRVLNTEKITLLAQGDMRNMTILNAWINGMTNDRELSFVLADEFGGKSSGQRRYIQRFKNRCREQLSDVV